MSVQVYRRSASLFHVEDVETGRIVGIRVTYFSALRLREQEQERVDAIERLRAQVKRPGSNSHPPGETPGGTL